jgi:hypothetical protein
MTEENVVQLPTLLDRLASRLINYLTRDAANREEWIAIQEGICLTLVEARDQFPADIEFGRWCEANGFDEKKLDYNKRAAAIEMGRAPEELRACLEATERNSLRTIHQYDFPRFHNVVKPAGRHTKVKNNLQPDRRKNTYQEAEAQTGLSSTVLRSAVAREEGRREAATQPPPLDPADMATTMRKRYEAAIRKARNELREEVRVEVQREFDIYVKHWKDKVERADRILRGFKGHISKDVFRKIKACLHPDHNSFAFAAEALQTFSELEKVLVKPDEPVLSGPPLPATAAEMMARRREYRR